MQSKAENLPDNWQVFEGAEQLAQTLTATILETAEASIKKKGSFHFITAGGTTPNRCYDLLSDADADWSKWHIYMGDERVLPFTNSERNSQALLIHWLKHNDVPVKQIHFMNTEAGIEKSAKAYAKLIAGIDTFDLCLLGMGEDGHTASLFPGHEEGESVKPAGTDDLNQAEVIMEFDSPKAPAERVSLNYPAFAKSEKLIKVITGAGKREALADWLSAEKTLPIEKVQGKSTEVWVSEDALPE